MKPNRLTRRRFFNDIIGAGMVLFLGKFTVTDSFGRTMPIAIQNNEMEYSRKIMVFSTQLEWIKDYNELCELVAEIGFEGLELTVRPGGYVLPERVEDDLPKVAEAAQKAGIEIIMISTHVTDPEDEFAEKIAKEVLGMAPENLAFLSAYYDTFLQTVDTSEGLPEPAVQ